MKILVLGGGNSPEREVSLRSAKAVAEACRAAGFDVEQADPSEGYSVLDNLSKDTLLFPLLHGKGGEDGEVQAELERRGLSFLGTGSQSSKVAFNKWSMRNQLRQSGIPFAKADLVHLSDYKNSELSKVPHVLKVHEGGSSIGVLIARRIEKLDISEVEEIFRLDPIAVLEELIEGVEITVPVLDDKALPVIEIKPPAGDEFDYENKYNGETEEICPPVSVSTELQKVAQSYAEKAHKMLGCRHLSRSDFIVTPAGQVVMLELNTMPGMTDQSLYPKSSAVAGMDFPELMKKFVALVKRDYKI